MMTAGIRAAADSHSDFSCFSSRAGLCDLFLYRLSQSSRETQAQLAGGRTGAGNELRGGISDNIDSDGFQSRDGLLDILALCHRETLIYLAEERPAKKAKKKKR